MTDMTREPEERSGDERAEYEAEVDEKVSSWEGKLADLKDELDDTGEDFKEWWAERVKHMRELLARLEKRAAELRESGDETWDGAKHRLEEAREEMREAWDRLTSRTKSDE